MAASYIYLALTGYTWWGRHTQQQRDYLEL